MKYRVALIAVLTAVAVLVVITVLRPPSPPSADTSASAQLYPVNERVAAPNFTGIDAWINTAPLSIASLRGKVVLVDFWTFSCVNCVRTIPHLQQLQSTYGREGFTIVGVHSPEFDFEKVVANVKAAVTRLHVTWPVAVDSQMQTWNAYANQYWPAEYLIDQQGRIAYANPGEGNYETTDMAVAALLGVHSQPGASSTAVPRDITPELYAGSERGQLADDARYGPPGQPTTYPDGGPPHDSDTIQVTGTWVNQIQYLVAQTPGHVRLKFTAGTVYVVAGTMSSPLLASMSVDGHAVAAAQSGSAVTARQSSFTVAREDLYQVLHGVSSGQHLIDLTVPAGFQLYTFTFG